MFKQVNSWRLRFNPQTNRDESLMQCAPKKTYKLLIVLCMFILPAITAAKSLPNSIDNKTKATAQKVKPRAPLFETQGKMFFFNFTGSGKRACNAFLVTDDDQHFCIIINKKSLELKKEAQNIPLLIKVKGKLFRINETPYISIVAYEIIKLPADSLKIRK